MKDQAVKTETFSAILKRGNKTIQADKAKRISAVAKMDYDNLVNNKKKEIFDVENQLEEMADISTSNVSTSMNAVTNFDSAAFVAKRANLRVKLVVMREHLRVLVEDEAFYN